MGKALIKSGGAEGLYQVQLQYERSRAEGEIARLTADLAAIVARLPSLQTEIDSAQLERDYLWQVWQAQISNYKNDPIEDNEASITAAQKALRQATATLGARKAALVRQRLRQLASQKRIDFLNDQLPADVEVAAWCADYNEQLAGEVGLIESGLVAGPQFIIKPGGVDGDQAGYSAASDGQLTPIWAQSAAAAFLNYARLPGQAKWRPRYRLASIASIASETDSCDLILDSATSSHQRLNINQAASLSNVPILYMGCNAEAFTVGDHVVVEFIEQDWDQPRVIGFVDHPQPCGLKPYLFIPVAPDVAGNYSHWHSLPFFDGIREIQWISGYKYNLQGFESGIGYRAGQSSLAPGFAVTPGIVWDMENHRVVPILHPETGAEITQTLRGDGSDPANDSIYPGVYPHVAAECLGIVWGAANVGGDDTSDGALTGDDKYGFGEGVLGLDRAATFQWEDGPDPDVMLMDYTSTAPGVWFYSGYGRWMVTHDGDDPIANPHSEWSMRAEHPTRSGSSSWLAAQRAAGPFIYDAGSYGDNIFASSMVWSDDEMVKSASGERDDWTQTVYSVDGQALFTIKNRRQVDYHRDNSFVWGDPGNSGKVTDSCDFSGFQNRSESNVSTYYDDKVQAFGSIYANRQRNRIALWKRIMHENEDQGTSGKIDEIEYSNACPLKSPELPRSLNASYDHSAARTTIGSASLAALIGDSSKLESSPTLLMTI